MDDFEFAKPKSSYKKLRCFQKGEAIKDLTSYFVKNHIPPKDRTKDQMVQAARSGKANIAEGRTDAAVSIEMEIKLYGVAVGSLEELLGDYEDYMRINKIPMWDSNHPRYENLREFCAKNNDTKVYSPLCERLNDEDFCNLMLTLIHQNLTMIRRLLELAKQDFLKFGGIKEQMHRARSAYRGRRGKK